MSHLHGYESELAVRAAELVFVGGLRFSDAFAVRLVNRAFLKAALSPDRYKRAVLDCSPKIRLPLLGVLKTDKIKNMNVHGLSSAINHRHGYAEY